MNNKKLQRFKKQKKHEHFSGGRPGVYTNIAEHLDWISERVNQQQEIVLVANTLQMFFCVGFIIERIK